MPISLSIYILHEKLTTAQFSMEYRKVQGLVGEQSFSVVLPKSYAIHLGIGKGDFVKVSQEERDHHRKKKCEHL